MRGPKLPHKEQLFLDAPEYKALRYEARDHPRDLAVLQVVFQTGIREGELCALTLQDLDLLAKELHVCARRGGVDTGIPPPGRLGAPAPLPGGAFSGRHQSALLEQDAPAP